MPPKRQRLPQTFPHKIVFIISLVLCLCACGSIVNAVIAWSNYLWGYYFGTGFWSGAVILLAGMFGIVASYVRSICAVKTFMIISIFGCIASLGMIALASGGLDAESGFYNGYNKTTFMTHVIHAVYLGLGVLQLSLGVLSNGICFYYLFIGRSAEIYCAKSDDKKKDKKKRGNIRREGRYRSSTGSQVPLVAESKQQKRNSKSISQRGSESFDENAEANEIFPIPYTAKGTLDRPALLRQEILMSKLTPVRTPCTRSASFSTFGRIGGPDRESLIVHPTDDNTSVADTVTTPQSLDEECHYAQTALFGPPVPIEDDEALPPYEIVDSSLSRNKPKRRGLKRPKSEELNVANRQSRGRNITPDGEKRSSSKRSRSSQVKSKIPPGKNEYPSEHDSLKKQSSKQSSNAFDENTLRLSRSADLLSLDDEKKDKQSLQNNSSLHEQDVACRDFAYSSDMILVKDQAVRLRHKRPQSQTMKVSRDRRLDRRRKALSAEFRLNKGFQERTGLEHRSDSIDGSNSSLFASNRIMPTKFSLRTPVRQIGMPHVCSPVRVKPLVHVPRVNPPPKPPRNYSVKAEDLKDLDIDMDDEVDSIFAEIDGLNNTENNDDVFAVRETNSDTNIKDERPFIGIEQNFGRVAGIEVSQVEKSDKFLLCSNNATINTNSTPLSPDVKLDSGPVLKFIAPKQETSAPIDKVDGTNNKKTMKSGSFSVKKNEEFHPENQSTDTMVLPSSPILRPPPVAFLKENKSAYSTTKHVAGNLSLENGVKPHSNPNTENTSDKNVEIVYSKVSKPSPTSPVSPASPTSPSAKVLKAKRLTYTFKDRDVSVFDPIGNSKELEETLEATESISVQYPVDRPKETEELKEISEQPIVEKHDSNRESRPNVIVRQPPLSPSERILQRKVNKVESQRDLSPSKEDRPVIIQPTNTFKDFNKNINGARPKTSYKGLFAPLVPPNKSHAIKTDIKQKEPDRPVSKGVSNGLSKILVSQQNSVTPQQMSKITTKKNSPPTLPKPLSVRATDNNKLIDSVPSSSVQFVPSNTSTISAIIQASGAATRDVPAKCTETFSVPPQSSSNSQGVLRLPQSQYSRQVSDTIPPPVPIANNDHVAGAAQNINIVQQINNNQPNRSLFSMVL